VYPPRLQHEQTDNATNGSQICRGLKDTVDASAELKLRIELAIDGLLLNRKGDFPANDLLNRVRAIRRAFETFDPPWNWSFDSPSTSYEQYEAWRSLIRSEII
jgi:hypothetical protein